MMFRFSQTAMAQDAGELDKPSAKRVHPAKRLYSPYAGGTK
jgi:hypothetical protein